MSKRLDNKVDETLTEFKLIETQISNSTSSNYEENKSVYVKYSELKKIADICFEYNNLQNQIEELESVIKDPDSNEIHELASEEIETLNTKLEKIHNELEDKFFNTDQDDTSNVIMEIRAGTGGEEASLFAQNLYRMYTRFAQRNGWKSNILNSNTTGLGGIKEIVFELIGENVYKNLKYESGVHRVQRIPSTESSGRIHTSAATVAVLPLPDEVDIEVSPNDLQIDVFHASGNGGQNVQKVATAIRITHVPTGIISVCQDERSQLKNKEKALSVLKARIYDMEKRKKEEERAKNRKEQVGSGDRSERIRTYNFPQRRVTDHRSKFTHNDIEKVLDGEFISIIESLTSMINE
ncbi:MAG: peptide chain release factor 1 [Dehalococcoidia bacterium]|nr:peptide chain release factor 1 [Chloroflexota bacterium]|tara:strand:+ start:16610 stop:17665 length:1056 start_codon:yes stop_codon:yes gene_type:complete